MITNKIQIVKENIDDYSFKIPNNFEVISLSIKKEIDWIKSSTDISQYIQEKILKDNFIYFWNKTHSFVSPTRINKVKSVWNDEKISWLKKENTKTFIHKDENGEFYSSFSEINKIQLKDAINFSRSKNECFIFIKLGEKIIDIHNLDLFLANNYKRCDYIFDFFVGKEIIILKVIGNFDDEYLTVDLYIPK